MVKTSLVTLGDLIDKEKKFSEEDESWMLSFIENAWTNHPWITQRFPKWKKYIAWVAGLQIYDVNTSTGALVVVPLSRRRKLVFNKLKGFVRTLIGKLSADRPQMGVVPNTDDQDDLEAAKVGDKLIEGLAQKLGFKKVLDTLKSWIIFTNVCFLRIFWNEADSGLVAVQPSEETDPETGQVVKGDPIRIYEDGDVGMEALNPFNCRPDPLFAGEPRKWRWFLYGERVDAEELEKKYDLEDGVLVDTDDSYSEILELPGAGLTWSGSGSDVIGRTCIQKHFWTKKFYVVTAGKQILEYGDNVYDEIPVYSTEDALIPTTSNQKGINYNDSVIKDAIPIQRDYNRQVSLASLGMELAQKVRVMTPFGSLASKKQFSDENGVFIDYNPKMGTPYQLKLDPLPPYFPSYKAGLEKELQDMFSLHEASFGQLPPRASHASGVLLNLLLEQDDIVLSPILISINDMLGFAWHAVLEMVQNNYNVGRLLRFMGDDGKYSVGKFKGADLKGNTDVTVVSQTGLPRSRPLRIEYLIKLKQVGLIQDDKLILEMMEFGGIDKLFKDSLLHERKAYRENDLIFNTPDIDPSLAVSWLCQLDEDETHLKIHARDRLSVKFESYEEVQKQALDAHIDAHTQKIQAAQQAAQAAQAPNPESAGEKPTDLMATIQRRENWNQAGQALD